MLFVIFTGTLNWRQQY